MDETLLKQRLREGWKPYYHKTAKRWYLRKGQKRKIIPPELESLASKMRPPVTKIFVDAREYRELKEEISNLRSRLEEFEAGEIELGLCPTCNQPVKLRDAKNHMRHVKEVVREIEKPIIVEKIVEKPEMPPEFEMYRRRAQLAESELERLQTRCQELETEIASGRHVLEFIRSVESKISAEELAMMIDREVQRRGSLFYGKDCARKAAEKVAETIASLMREEWSARFGSKIIHV